MGHHEVVFECCRRIDRSSYQDVTPGRFELITSWGSLIRLADSTCVMVFFLKFLGSVTNAPFAGLVFPERIEPLALLLSL